MGERVEAKTGPFTGNWVWDMWITAYEVFKREYEIDDDRLKTVFPYVVITLYAPLKNINTDEDRDRLLKTVVEKAKEGELESLKNTFLSFKVQTNDKGKPRLFTNHKGLLKNFWIFNQRFSTLKEVIGLLQAYSYNELSFESLFKKGVSPNTLWKLFPSTDKIPTASYTPMKKFIPEELWGRDDIRLGLLLYPHYTFIRWKGSSRFFYYPSKEKTVDIMYNLREMERTKEEIAYADIIDAVLGPAPTPDQMALENLLQGLYIIEIGRIDKDQKPADVRYFITSRERAKVLLSKYGDTYLYKVLDTNIALDKEGRVWKNLLDLFIEGYPLFPFAKRHFLVRENSYVVKIATYTDLKLRNVSPRCPGFVFTDVETKNQTLRRILKSDLLTSVNVILRLVVQGKLKVVSTEMFESFMREVLGSESAYLILLHCISSATVEGGGMNGNSEKE